MLDEIIKQGLLFIGTFAANLFASVSGGGAGFVQFPLLILLGLPFATALGSHKVAVVFLGIGALAKKSRMHDHSFSLDKQVGLIMTLLCIPAVVSGSLIIVNVPTHQAEIVLGFITIAAGIYTFFKKSFGAQRIEHRSLTRTVLGTICLILIGMFSGSLSSGAGLFATLTLVGIMGLDLKNAIFHTMIFVATIWNGVGAVTIGMVASIHWQWIPTMIIGTILGSYFGTSLMIKLPVKTVKKVFSMVAIFSGVMLIYAAYR